MRFSRLLGPRRVLLTVVFGGLLILAGSSGPLASPGERPASDRRGSVSCRILDPNGNATTEVAAMSFGDLAYWLEFRSSGALARTVEFRTVPLFPGSPARSQLQRFNTDDSNVVTTPFGVPDWGLDKTSGPWALTVRDNLGRSATCEFEVVP
jgi:hypothetical protein